VAIGRPIVVQRVSGNRQHEEESMSYACRIVEAPAQPVAAIRVRVKTEEFGGVLATLLPEVFVWLQTQGATPAGRPFTRYIEMGTAEGEIEAGIPIPEGLTGEGRIGIGELPEGTLAATSHFSPYEKLSEARAALTAWLASGGRTPSGSPWESYVTDPTEEPDSNRRETQVFYPL
jgi:AraC family transcriptional regulator